MKLTLLPAVTALAFAAVAHASNISGTVTGTITGAQDYDQNGNSYGAIDATGLFGGGDLLGQSFTLTFSYDASLMVENGISCSNFTCIYDYSSDGALTNGLTIAGQSLVVAGRDEFVDTTGAVGAPGSCCITFEESSADDGLGPIVVFYANILVPPSPSNLTDQLSVDTILSELRGGTIAVDKNPNSCCGTSYDNIDVSNIEISSASPEPATWILLAIAVGWSALLKLRTAASRGVRG